MSRCPLATHGIFSKFVFSQTLEAFKKSDRQVSGFRLRQKNAAERVRPGDKLLCYVTKLSLWVGVLEVVSGPYVDDQPIFLPESDPFVVRFKVRPLMLLDLEKSVPIYEDVLWHSLSFTRDHEKGTSTWTGKIRSSLVSIDEGDGRILEDVLRQQLNDGRTYSFDIEEYLKLSKQIIRRADKVVSVSVPNDLEVEEVENTQQETEVRESIRVQALIADIGSQMGLRVWVPKSDKAAIVRETPRVREALLDRLPLNYDDVTLRTIEQIDVLWLRGRSIVRAFEVEHTTSVYSGILRMADLLALQPNMDIKVHIVAPTVKREKVFQEIRRPVFSLLDRGPLSENCTYISYDGIRELARQKHLSHLSDSVLDEYMEEAD